MIKERQLEKVFSQMIEMDLNGSKVMSLALTCYELHCMYSEIYEIKVHDTLT
jgi:hypothetical protein